MMKRFVRTMMIPAFFAGSLVAFSGCQPEEGPGPGEKAGKALDETAKNVGEKAKEGMEKAKEGLEKVEDKAKDAFEGAKEKASGAAKPVEKPSGEK